MKRVWILNEFGVKLKLYLFNRDWVEKFKVL